MKTLIGIFWIISMSCEIVTEQANEYMYVIVGKIYLQNLSAFIFIHFIRNSQKVDDWRVICFMRV